MRILKRFGKELVILAICLFLGGILIYVLGELFFDYWLMAPISDGIYTAITGDPKHSTVYTRTLICITFFAPYVLVTIVRITRYMIKSTSTGKHSPPPPQRPQPPPP